MTSPYAPLVWIASYPKSGNTWVRVLLANYLNPGIDDGNIPLVGLSSPMRFDFDNAIGLESADLSDDEVDLLRPEVYRRLARNARQDQRFVKLHDAFRHNRAGASLFPPECSQGTVLLVRHPVDVAVSYSHYLGNSDLERTVQRMSDPQDSMGGGKLPQYRQFTGGWSGHYRSWMQQSQIPVLVVRYEDLLVDAAREFARILGFLGLDPDLPRIEEAVRRSRFDRLQAIEQSSGFRETPVTSERFFRSGRAGEGIANMPARLRERLVEANAEVMAQLGYSADGAAPSSSS